MLKGDKVFLHNCGKPLSIVLHMLIRNQIHYVFHRMWKTLISTLNTYIIGFFDVDNLWKRNLKA